MKNRKIYFEIHPHVGFSNTDFTMWTNGNEELQLKVLPEDIAYIPVRAYSAGNNPTLSIALRWIINGLKIAYASEISSQTVDTYSATKSQSVKNLLGFDDKVWKTLKINPEWVKSYIKEYGNYQQILENVISYLLYKNFYHHKYNISN